MNITGTAQNLSDGTVKIIAEGEKTNLSTFIEEIDIKNFLIRVTNIERKDSEYIGEYESFYKLVGDGETDERLDTAAELLKELIVVTKGGFDRVEKKLDSRFDSLESIIRNQKNKLVHDSINPPGIKADSSE
jgi:hypothetical protein